jgi:hypothetical protein
MRDEIPMIPCPGCHGRYTDDTRITHMGVCTGRGSTPPEAYLTYAQYRELYPDLGGAKAKAEAALREEREPELARIMLRLLAENAGLRAELASTGGTEAITEREEIDALERQARMLRDNLKPR